MKSWSLVDYYQSFGEQVSDKEVMRSYKTLETT